MSKALKNFKIMDYHTTYSRKTGISHNTQTMNACLIQMCLECCVISSKCAKYTILALLYTS